MEMVTNETTPTWRNFAAWGAVGAGAYILVVCGGVIAPASRQHGRITRRTAPI